MAVDQVLERGGRLLDAKCVCLFMCLNFLDVHQVAAYLLTPACCTNRREKEKMLIFAKLCVETFLSPITPQQQQKMLCHCCYKFAT